MAQAFIDLTRNSHAMNFSPRFRSCSSCIQNIALGQISFPITKCRNKEVLLRTRILLILIDCAI
ncbi:hypothetical protein NEUTE2DRAFT_70157 [Neurospora tetrasperma FGSC 2509]|nr:hypothetical protein NEUTE2DRAFT_70157 [Neurospora tetrasperma FGSC 2509]